MPGQIVGYARVSSTSQNLARQLEAVGAVDELFTDHQSGKSRADRAGLSDALRYVRRGDTLRVASMDRLARSLIDLEQIVSDLTARKVSVEFVKERLTFTPDATADPFATFQRQLIGAVAELERSYPRTPTRRHRPGQSPRRVPGPRPPPHRRTDRPRASGGGRGRAQGEDRYEPWCLTPPHLRRHCRQRRLRGQATNATPIPVLRG